MVPVLTVPTRLTDVRGKCSGVKEKNLTSKVTHPLADARGTDRVCDQSNKNRTVSVSEWMGHFY